MPGRHHRCVSSTHASSASSASLDLFEKAKWLVSEAERDTLERPADNDQGSLPELSASLLDRVQIAPDKVATAVDLFPLPGFTAGHVRPTDRRPAEHDAYHRPGRRIARSLRRRASAARLRRYEPAKESLQEIYDIADIIVPGYDNYFASPMRLMKADE